MMPTFKIGLLAAAVLLATSLQVVSARHLTQTGCRACSNGYTSYPISVPGNGQCSYYCSTPIPLACANSAMPAYIYGSIPKFCGGFLNTTCPSLACAASSATAISGPQGCSSAKSSVSALAVSQSTFNLAPALMAPFFQQDYGLEYANGVFVADGTPDPTVNQQAALTIAANATSIAFANAVATTLTQYSTLVCSCCRGGSVAYATVNASVQAVANATAQSVQALAAAVINSAALSDANLASPNPIPFLLAASAASASALATDVELAVDSVFKYVSSTGAGSTVISIFGTQVSCNSANLQPLLVKAIAQASVCTFLDIYASAVNAITPGVAYACSTSVAFAGYGSPMVCTAGISCPCNPASYQYTNLGFDYDGTFTDGQPSWTPVSSGAATPPSVIQQASLSIGSTHHPKILVADTPQYFAAVPAGCETNTLNTSFVVPPCATSIQAKYVFDCNTQGFKFNNYGAGNGISIVVTDFYSGALINTGAINPSCPPESNPPTPYATNGGKWSTVSVSVPPGYYNVAIVVSSTAAGFNGDDDMATTGLQYGDDGVNNCDSTYSSVLYIDSVSFS